MESLLFLVHRVPFPPNKGDKIRSYNLLKALSKQYRIYLGTFVDEPADRESSAGIESYCEEIKTVEINPRLRRLMSVTALLSGNPLSIEFYKSQHLKTWVEEVIEEHEITKILCFSAAMAQFVESYGGEKYSRFIDFVDVDSEKWREYSQRQKWPMSWIYGRESKTLLSYEKHISSSFDLSIFVTNSEVELFRTRSSLENKPIKAIENGVDTEYFVPSSNFSDPYSNKELALVFTGAMDYWANVDAVTWFATTIFPGLKSRYPELSFWIVGTRPSADVQKLEAIDGVVVTGAVDDIRPYLHYAKLSVAPLRIARGVQNKVLEAMAMAKPVVATKNAMEGINLNSSFFELVADDQDGLISAVERVINDDFDATLGKKGRDYVISNHNWDAQTTKLVKLMGKTRIDTT